MRSTFIFASLASGVFGARSFINEPDTGIDDALGSLAIGQLPNITDMIGLNDFDWAARHYLPLMNYTYYRNGAGGEWSYRNNLEVFNRYRLRPKVMSDITGVEASLTTTILGHSFAAPFFVSPCARGGYGHPDAELNIMKGTGSGNVLYIVSGFSSKPIEEIAAVKAANQTFFSQVYTTANDTANQILFDRAEASGAKALVWAIDAPGSPSRHRALRQGVTSAVSSLNRIDYEVLEKYRNQTTLPIVLKGIQSAADARAAIQHNVPAIILSNHGGRNLDGSPSSLEIAIEIYKEDPDVFKEIEVLADGGVRYGTDALRLLALGVKAVGLGRPFMYANVFGVEGIEKAVSIIRSEIMNDAANLGVGDLKTIDASFVNWEPNHWYS